jgi:hypothetical protein
VAVVSAEIQIGKFTLCRYDDNSTWISRGDGEGGGFSDKLLEEVIEEFYIKHL